MERNCHPGLKISAPKACLLLTKQCKNIKAQKAEIEGYGNKKVQFNNLKKAQALVYNREEGVPRLLAKGRGRGAEQIITLAREAGVEIVEDTALAALLDAGVNPGDFIPTWCWEEVAKILAFVLSKEKG